MVEIYPVYILSRVADEIMELCKKAAPKETLGRLLGYRCQWENKPYIKVVDWVSGKLEASPVFATFTPEGVRECEIFLDERYGASPERPTETGLFHSHPFGTDPHFSSTDYATFLTFPYDKEGNVFVLIDPISRFFKVFIISCDEQGKKILQQVRWIEYCPYGI